MNVVYIVTEHSKMTDGYEYTNIAEICDSIDSAFNYIFEQRRPFLLHGQIAVNVMLDFVTNAFHIRKDPKKDDTPIYYTIEPMEVKHYGK